MAGLQNEDMGQLFEMIKQARSGPAKVVASGAQGVEAGMARGMEERKQALAAEIAKLDSGRKDRETTANEADTQLKYLLANQPSTTTDPVSGKKTETQGLTGVSFEPGKGTRFAPGWTVGSKPGKPTQPEQTDVAIFDVDGKFYNQDGTPRATPINPATTKIINGPKPSAGGTAASPESLLADLDAIEAKLQNVPTSVLGAATSLASTVTGGSIGEDTKVYNDVKPAMAAKFYRAVTKDTRLSDQDAESRALPLFPSAYDAAAVRQKKLAFLRQAALNLKAGKSVTPEDFVTGTLAPAAPSGTQTPSQGQTEAIHTYPSGRKVKYNDATGKWEPYNGQ